MVLVLFLLRMEVGFELPDFFVSGGNLVLQGRPGVLLLVLGLRQQVG